MTEALDIGDVVAAQVRSYRKLRGMTVRELAAACGDPDLTEAAITNLERPSAGARPRRPASARDLFVLGRALNVPPLLLVLPVGSALSVQVAPGVVLSPIEAFTWACGQQSLETSEEGQAAFEQATRPLKEEQHHARLVAAAIEARQRLGEMQESLAGVDGEAREQWRQVSEHYRTNLGTTLEQLDAWRDHVAQMPGRVLPALPAELAVELERDRRSRGHL